MLVIPGVGTSEVIFREPAVDSPEGSPPNLPKISCVSCEGNRGIFLFPWLRGDAWK